MKTYEPPRAPSPPRTPKDKDIGILKNSILALAFPGGRGVRGGKNFFKDV
jgi:hypothetical protein